MMTCKRILAEKPDDESAKASLKALEDIMSERKIIDAHFAQMPFGTDYALVNAAKDAGIRFMLSNSDCKGKNEEDNLFDVLYGAYDRTRIYEQNGTPNIVCRNYKKN